tara:strand:- start:7921 stop:8046 length:126 start_codon:yes stop_codon:yes gene_type:complete
MDNAGGVFDLAIEPDNCGFSIRFDVCAAARQRNNSFRQHLT